VPTESGLVIDALEDIGGDLDGIKREVGKQPHFEVVGHSHYNGRFRVDRDKKGGHVGDELDICSFSTLALKEVIRGFVLVAPMAKCDFVAVFA
jgi:hypothetical protein